MNSLWPVLQTYLWRPRFWVLTAVYIALVWLFLYWFASVPTKADTRRDFLVAQSIVSAVFACTAGCFFALHVRRQFTTELAGTTPGYATPHLIVAGLVTAWLCIVMPIVAIMAGLWPSGTLALHAAAAILMAIVIIWPRGLVLLLAIPIIAVWSDRVRPRDTEPLILELMQGRRPELAYTIIAAAIIAVGLAAWHLLRLPRMGLTTNDELSVDLTAAADDTNPLNRWILSTRDARAARLIAAAPFSRVQRWRAPVAISLAQLCIPAIVVGLASLIGWFLLNPSEWAILSTTITCAILLLVPLNSMQLRSRAMSQEVLRPVTRESYFRQALAAMSWDVATWMAVASALIVVVSFADFVFRLSEWGEFWHRHSSGQYEVYRYLLIDGLSLALLWSMALLVFGLGAATLRWPFWLPIVAAATMVWFLGGMYAVIEIEQNYHPHVTGDYLLLLFALLSAVVGAMLLRLTYSRWLRLDVE